MEGKFHITKILYSHQIHCISISFYFSDSFLFPHFFSAISQFSGRLFLPRVTVPFPAEILTTLTRLRVFVYFCLASSSLYSKKRKNPALLQLQKIYITRTCENVSTFFCFLLLSKTFFNLFRCSLRIWRVWPEFSMCGAAKWHHGLPSSSSSCLWPLLGAQCCIFPLCRRREHHQPSDSASPHPSPRHSRCPTPTLAPPCPAATPTLWLPSQSNGVMMYILWSLLKLCLPSIFLSQIFVDVIAPSLFIKHKSAVFQLLSVKDKTQNENRSRVRMKDCHEH